MQIPLLQALNKSINHSCAHQCQTNSYQDDTVIFELNEPNQSVTDLGQTSKNALQTICASSKLVF